MAIKQCPNCGKEYSADNKFCTKCGVKLVDVVQSTPMNNVVMPVTSYQNTGAPHQTPPPHQMPPPHQTPPPRQTPPQYQVPPQPNYGVKPRGIVVAIILSIVTCGLYGTYWMVKLTDEMNILLDRKNATSGLMSVIFTIITCGLYGLYWIYKLGDNVDRIKGNPGGNTGILYLILSFFSMGLIPFALAQDTINDKLEGLY